MSKPDQNKIIDNIQSSLKLPFEFQANAVEWENELAEQFRKSTIGTLIIMAIGTLACLFFGGGIVIMALAAVMIMFFISQLKKRKELTALANHKFILTQESITSTSPDSQLKVIAINDVKEVSLFRWGLQVKKKVKDSKDDILIPVSVPQFEGMVKHFEDLGLLVGN